MSVTSYTHAHEAPTSVDLMISEVFEIIDPPAFDKLHDENSFLTPQYLRNNKRCLAQFSKVRFAVLSVSCFVAEVHFQWKAADVTVSAICVRGVLCSLLLHLFTEPGEFEGREEELDYLEEEGPIDRTERDDGRGTCKHSHSLHVEQHELAEFGMHELDCDFASRNPVCCDMDLSKRRYPNRRGGEVAEQILYRLADVFEKHLLYVRKWRREAVILQRTHCRRPFFGNQLYRR